MVTILYENIDTVDITKTSVYIVYNPYHWNSFIFKMQLHVVYFLSPKEQFPGDEWWIFCGGMGAIE